MIQQGALPFEARLPPTRELARDLGCSRNIVLLAYEQLVLEGYLVTRQGAGTFVSPAWPTSRERPRAAPASRDAVAPCGCRSAAASASRSPSGRRPAMSAPHRALPIDFMYGLCEPDPRVRARLRTAFQAAHPRREAFRYGPPAGDPELRQQLADRIRAARGIETTPDQIVVTSGTQQALDICVRLLLDPGDRIIVEDPGYLAGACGLCARPAPR